MYCKAGVACTNPEVYGDIKRGRRLAPSKGITCPRCQGKCCNEACLEKHKCKQRARPSPSVHNQGGRMGHPRWQLDPNSYELKPYDATGQLGMADPMALLRGQGGLLLPQQQFPQGIVLGAGPGGNMLPIIPMLPGMFPLMINPAGLQQGADGGIQADQLQAALAAMQQTSGGLVAGSAPMMLGTLPGQDGTVDAAASASQALQFAQLQGLTGHGQLPTLLQLTVQPDGNIVQANGQRLQLPAGLMQGMPLQLPGGLQILSAEGLQLATDSSGNMQMMQVLSHDGTMAGADQATVDAAVAAAAAASAAGQAGLPLMAGLTAMGANLLDSSALAAAAAAATEAAEQQAVAVPEQGVVGSEQDPATAAAVAAAAEAAAAGHQGVVDAAALQHALNAAAAANGQVLTGDPMVDYAQQVADAQTAAAAVAAGAPTDAQAMADPSLAAAMPNPEGAVSAAPAELPLPTMADAVAAGGASGVSSLPAIAPLNMTPALTDALKAVASGRPGHYNPEEDAATALMSLATDKKNKAAELMRQAEAAVAAAKEGIIPQASADLVVEQARKLQEEAEAEERAAAEKAAQQAAAQQAAEAELKAQLEQQVAQQQLQVQQQLEAQQQMEQLHQLQQQIEAQQQLQAQQQMETQQQLEAAMAAHQQLQAVAAAQPEQLQGEEAQPQMEAS